MLASTVKFSKNERAHHQHQPPTDDQARQMVRKKAPPTGNRPFRTQQRANKPPHHFPLPENRVVLTGDDSQSMFHQPEPSSREHMPRN